MALEPVGDIKAASRPLRQIFRGRVGDKGQPTDPYPARVIEQPTHRQTNFYIHSASSQKGSRVTMTTA